MYELPVSTEEYKEQKRRAIEVIGNAKPIDPWRGGRIHGYVEKEKLKQFRIALEDEIEKHRAGMDSYCLLGLERALQIFYSVENHWQDALE